MEEVECQKSVGEVRNLLKIIWCPKLDEKLNRFDHCLNFPFSITHFTDSMPISCVSQLTSGTRNMHPMFTW